MDVVRNQDERRRGYYFFVILDKVGWPGVKKCIWGLFNEFKNNQLYFKNL